MVEKKLNGYQIMPTYQSNKYIWLQIVSNCRGGHFKFINKFHVKIYKNMNLIVALQMVEKVERNKAVGCIKFQVVEERIKYQIKHSMQNI